MLQNKQMIQSQQNKSDQKKSPSKSTHHLRYTDFEFIKILGVGAYGKVQLVQRKGMKYALKIIQKRLLAKQGKQYQVFVQRQLLKRMNHPGVINLKTCFQDRQNLYFLMQYCQGGTFSNFLMVNQSRISTQLRVFYIAQIVNIIQYFQKIGIVHRDLKPQNILLSENGHIKIVDYGTAEVSQCNLVDQKFKVQLGVQKKASQQGQLLPMIKFGSVSQNSQKYQNQEQKSEGPEANKSVKQYKIRRKATFVGTCYYVPPELLQKEECHPSTDIWALGCIMYQLYYNTPPFEGASQFQVFEKIKNIQYKFPKNEKISEDAIDLIKKLLKKNPLQRLGCNSKQGLMMSDLKSHKYFKGVNFQKLFDEQIPILIQQQQINPVQKQKQRLQRINNIVVNNYASILQKYESILIQGVIQKRTFINFNYYYLIVFNNLMMLRIKLIEPGKVKQTNIDLQKISFDTKDCLPAEEISQNVFKLVTQQKLYKLKSCQPMRWVNTINKRYKQIRHQNEMQRQMQKENQRKDYEKQIQRQIKTISEALRTIKINMEQL